MIWMGIAWAADPSALRQLDEGGATVDVSTDAVGVAATVGPVGLSVHHDYGATLGVHAGLRRRLVGVDRDWGLDVVGTGGLAGLLATPGIALVVSGELRGGVTTDRFEATGGLVVPLAFRLDAPQLAAPLGLESRVATRLGPVWVGGRAQMGGTITAGATPAIRTTLGFVLMVR